MNNLQKLLEAYHELLDEFFLIHQEPLILGDINLAKEYLIYYAQLLRQHIEIENNYLFPLYKKNDPNVSGRWPVTLYIHEHNKIEQLLVGVETLMLKLESQYSARGVIHLLEVEYRLKQLVEHHEQREEIALLPELCERLSILEEQSLMLTIQQYWPSLVLLQETMDHFKSRIQVQ